MGFTKRQIEIIEAAAVLIGEKGIQNLTTRNLAAKIGFSEPALYRHFKNKTEILKSLLLFYKEKLAKGLYEITSSNISGLEKIRQMMSFQFNHFTKNPAVIMVIFSETSFQNESVLANTVSEIMQQKKTAVAKIIDEGKQDASIRNDVGTDQTTTVIMGSMRFLVLRWRLANFKFNLTEEGEELWNTMDVILSH